MPREFSRTKRVSEQVRRLLNQLILTELKDPRAASVTVTECDVSRDLSHATVFFSLLDPDSDPEPTAKALKGAAGFLRSQLRKAMDTRQVPALKFVHDQSVASGVRISALIDEAVSKDKSRTQDNEHE
ncbi:MAG: 30S ribosome-binding factor RbfA [Proteobacteria bacterium]|nr:30S ribosome-binding factor RbfA [Pseudomonadota bacterium]